MKTKKSRKECTVICYGNTNTSFKVVHHPVNDNAQVQINDPSKGIAYCIELTKYPTISIFKLTKNGYLSACYRYKDKILISP